MLRAWVLALLFPAFGHLGWLAESLHDQPLYPVAADLLVAAMRRFHALISAIETTSAASCGSL